MRIGIIGAGRIGGTLAEGGRKHQPGTAAYTEGLHTGGLRARLA
jgi:prephenate dehydrogenase